MVDGVLVKAAGRRKSTKVDKMLIKPAGILEPARQARQRGPARAFPENRQKTQQGPQKVGLVTASRRSEKTLRKSG